jgi:hypothetical protein
VQDTFADWQPQYAERRVATFPVTIGGDEKKPSVVGYMKVGLRGSAQLANKFPDASSFGFSCGPQNGLTVLDMDDADPAIIKEAGMEPDHLVAVPLRVEQFDALLRFGKLADDLVADIAPAGLILDHARVDTLRHGATDEEVEFLKEERVELNAMTSRRMVDFIEAKLTKHGVAKVVPDAGTIEAHARRLIEQRLAREALSEIREEIATAAARIALPENIESRLRRSLTARPELSWDDALADIIDGSNPV